MPDLKAPAVPVRSHFVQLDFASPVGRAERIPLPQVDPDQLDQLLLPEAEIFNDKALVPAPPGQAVGAAAAAAPAAAPVHAAAGDVAQRQEGQVEPFRRAQGNVWKQGALGRRDELHRGGQRSRRQLAEARQGREEKGQPEEQVDAIRRRPSNIEARHWLVVLVFFLRRGVCRVAWALLHCVA